MDITRGDVVLVVAPKKYGGGYGKPRPAAVVQSNLFNATYASVVVCPITSDATDAPLFRLPVSPSASNGLKRESQLMVDKLLALRRDHIRRRIGALQPAQTRLLDHALRLWLALDAG